MVVNQCLKAVKGYIWCDSTINCIKIITKGKRAEIFLFMLYS